MLAICLNAIKIVYAMQNKRLATQCYFLDRLNRTYNAIHELKRGIL